LSERLDGLLRELQALEIIYEQGLVPEPAYIFKHAVIQDVAYQSLLILRRKELHRAVGEAIEELYPDRLEEHDTELAHHFSQGEVWGKALAYCRQAGEKAVARSAYREAVAYFDQVLAALEHISECHETLAQAVGLRLDLRNALVPLDEQARAFEHLRAAEPLAERLGDPQRLELIVASLCFSFSIMGEHDCAIAAGQRALALATTRGAFDVQVNAQNNLSVAYHAAGDYRQVLDVAQRTIAVFTGELSLSALASPSALAYSAVAMSPCVWPNWETSLRGLGEGKKPYAWLRR
jgi:predicted ATPase